MTRRALVDGGFESVAGGAKFLAIGKSRMYELVRAGVLSHATVGGKIVISRLALREYALLKLKVGSIA